MKKRRLRTRRLNLDFACPLHSVPHEEGKRRLAIIRHNLGKQP